MSSPSYVKSLDIEFVKEKLYHDYIDKTLRSRSVLPFKKSQPILAPVTNFDEHAVDDESSVYSLSISLQQGALSGSMTMEDFTSFDYLPGDTIGVLPENNPDEVKRLISRLNYKEYAFTTFKLKVLPDNPKKWQNIPHHLPTVGCLHEVFTFNIDLRFVLKKRFLRALIMYTETCDEADYLMKIFSSPGSPAYVELLEEVRTLQMFLDKFPSCNPPIETVLEFSKPLLPRPYSITTSPLSRHQKVGITFVDHKSDDSRLKGVCTSFLKNCRESIPFYLREPSAFRFPTDVTKPIIMIATGTGIAPFMSFLRHRYYLLKGGQELGEAFLYYGVRYSDRDYLFQNELELMTTTPGCLTELYMAFSRDEDKPIYVTHSMRQNGAELVFYLLTKKALLYVCGNPKTVGKDVRNALKFIFTEFADMHVVQAEEALQVLTREGRYLVDSW